MTSALFLKLLDRSAHWDGCSPGNTASSSVGVHAVALALMLCVKYDPTPQLASLIDIQLVGLGASKPAVENVIVPKRADSVETDRPRTALVSNPRRVNVENAIPIRIPQAVKRAPLQAVRVSSASPIGESEAVMFVQSETAVTEDVSGTGVVDGTSQIQDATVAQSSGAAETSAAADSLSQPKLTGTGSPNVGIATNPEPETIADANAEVLSSMEARTTQIPLNMYNSSQWASVYAEELDIFERREPQAYNNFKYGESRGQIFMQFGYREYIPRASFTDFQAALDVNNTLMETAIARTGNNSWQTRELRTNQALLFACLGNEEKAIEIADACPDQYISGRSTRSLASLYLEIAEIAVYHEKWTVAEQLLPKLQTPAMSKAIQNARWRPGLMANETRIQHLVEEVAKHKQAAVKTAASMGKPD